MKQVKAPWSPQEVQTLIKWQARTDIHPFTCDAGHVLTPTTGGLVCLTCPDWVWDIMLIGEPESDLAKNLHRKLSEADKLVTELNKLYTDTVTSIAKIKEGLERLK